MVDPDDIKCVKIPEEELTDFEKKKIEHFEPPKQLGIDDVNEGGVCELCTSGLDGLVHCRLEL